MTTQPRLPGVTAPVTYTPSVARQAIAAGRRALAVAKAKRRPHPDEAAVLRRARALDALDRVTDRTGALR